MKINTIQNNTAFGAIKPTQKAESILFDRLKKPVWNLEYKDTVIAQEKNNIDILLDGGKYNRLEAVFRSPEGLMIKEKENYFSSILKLNPMKFIQKMCKKANDLNT